MTDGLRPCPCCGSNLLHIVAPDDGCYCWNCGLTMPKRPNWIDRWNRRTTDNLKDLLINIDSWHELLGTELLEAFYDGYFDPDANFTPLEHHLKLLYEALGFNKDEIRNEAYKLSKKRLGEKEESE